MRPEEFVNVWWSPLTWSTKSGRDHMLTVGDRRFKEAVAALLAG